MKLYSQSIFLTDFATATFSGASSVDEAFDNDKLTISQTTQSNPTFEMDFGSGETRTASALWLRVRGYTAVSVMADGTQVASSAIDGTGYLYLEFTESTAQQWRLVFTGTGGIYEAYLCELLLDFDTDDQRPFWRMTRHNGISHRAAGGALIMFIPFGFGQGRTSVTLSWILLDNISVQSLRRAWQNSLANNFRFCVYPAPDERPNKFFAVRWESDFGFRYTGSKLSDGQSGDVVFVEDGISLGVR